MIKKAIIIHGSIYGYGKVIFKGAHTKVQIWCPYCQDYFWQTPSNHTHIDKKGCNVCGYKIVAGKLGLTKEEYIIRAIKKFKNKEFSYAKVVYVDYYTEITITSKKFGNFKLKPVLHLKNKYGFPDYLVNREYKGGITRLNLPLYSTFSLRLKPYQKVFKLEKYIEGNLLELLGVECHYCKKIFVPKAKEVKARIKAIGSTNMGEANLFCSEKCKENCPTFRQQKYPKGQNPNLSRVHQKEWSNLVKGDANYVCQICGKTGGTIHSHHEIPVVVNPLLSLDLDNGICLCKGCHNLTHQLPWCKLSYLRNCRIRKNK